MDESTGRRRGRLALAALLVVTGVLHFVVPEPYVRIIPRVLPDDWARPLVYASGVAEIVGGGLLFRRRAGWFVVALLVALFPANVQMALDDPNPLTIGRLPLQAPMIWAAWPAATPARRPRP
ncbi:MAG TPA: MauE/DoxX family redox-associated membrane protein [Acidimicrobiales bacterium]|nr:MauE/DoxX family redox-associated membrane protein [Acidimicrobiales bacterium]